MKVDCYVLDIYCDNKDCLAFGLSESEQYTGRNKTEAYQKAREAGWTIGKRDICAACKDKWI